MAVTLKNTILWGEMPCIWYFLKYDFTCSMPEDVGDSGHIMLPVVQFL